MEHLKRAVAIFSEVGGDERTRLPEIWKLVELVSRRFRNGSRTGRP